MLLRLLGPVELVWQDNALDLGGPRQRTVLAMLGLNANRVTSVEALTDAIWQDAPPPTARGQIQVSISALRRQFATAGRPTAIRTAPPGYQLALGSADVDSLVFGELLNRADERSSAGDVSGAEETLRTALTLWRGPALAGLSSELVRRGATALDSRRLNAIEERIRLRLMLGQHREVGAELPQLISEYPLRERLHGFLMLALYRSGRQAEALEVYRRARAILIDEIGVEPGPELAELERSILNRAAELDLPARAAPAAPVAPAAETAPVRPEFDMFVTPRQLPASIADFTGRAGQLAVITSYLTDPSQRTHSYAMPIVAISGKGGVGKSVLAIRVAHELSTSFPDGHLYADIAATDGDDVTSVLLGRFLRALSVPSRSIPEDAGERAELYRSMLADRRILVVLDGVVDEAQVLPLLPGSASCAVITTSRSRLSRLVGARWVDVDVFDRTAARDLLAKMIGPERVREESTAADELARLCDGLPLALRIAGARLASRASWRLDALVHRLGVERSRLDELTYRSLELRSSIGLTYEGLTTREQRLFRLLALIQAPSWPAWLAAALLDTDLRTAEQTIDSLVDARVLDTVDDPDTVMPHYRYHDLVRLYARERALATEPVAERDAALARALGGWLGMVSAAHRLDYGGDYTIVHGKAPTWSLTEDELAAVDLRPLSRWDGERPALVAAIRQAAELGLDELCWDLALTSVTLFEAKGYFDDWSQSTRLARDAALRADNRTGLAAMDYSLGTLHIFQMRLDQADECFRSALTLFESEGNVHGQALVLRNAAHIDELRGNTTEMMIKYSSALETMREVGDRAGAAHILRSQAGFWLADGDIETARSLLEQALKICYDEQCLRLEAQVMQRFSQLYVVTEEFDAAREALHRVLRIVRDSGDKIGEAYAMYGLGVVRHREGRLDAATTSLSHAAELSRRVGERLIEARSRYALGEIALAAGEPGLAAAHLEAARALFEMLGSVVWHARARKLLAEAKSGDPASAAEEIRAAIELLGALATDESSALLGELRELATTLS
ncbi:MAG TPA: BTAD domain-containing putative transcriptional regulator [Pseudonocardiaceae bacterium]